MSAPKRGMVAGQPIQTQAQSKEFDEGYERVFGNEPKTWRDRGRFIWSEEARACIRVDADWTDAERRAQTTTEGVEYSNAQTTDGVDISSRTKRREYMKATGVTDSSDFSPAYVERRKKDAQREQDKQRKADMVTTYKQLRKE